MSPHQNNPRRSGGFTLIELLLVLGMLVIVLSVSAPLLVRFFHGRNLDAEARRFLGLTRYAQSRAVAEGVPMILWMDTDAGAYGLETENTFTREDAKAVDFNLALDVAMEVERPPMAALSPTLTWKEPTRLKSNKQPEIRFTPDGFISESSPELIIFRQTGPEGRNAPELEGEEIYVGRSDNRLNYEIRTNLIVRARR